MKADFREYREKRKSGFKSDEPRPKIPKKEIDEANDYPLELLIGRMYTIDDRGHGSYMRTIEHDSLVISRNRNRYFWYSRTDQSGDVEKGSPIDWCMRYMGMNFPQAVEYLRGIPGSRSPVYKHVKTWTPNKVVELDQDLYRKYHEGLNKRGYEWWGARGIPADIVDELFLGQTRWSYTIPVWDAFGTGKLVNMRHRRAAPGGLRYLPEKVITPDDPDGVYVPGAQLYVPRMKVLQNSPYFLWVTGEIKAIVCYVHGIPALATTAGCESWMIEWAELIGDREVYTIFDPGEEKQAKRVSEKMRTDGVKVTEVPTLPGDIDDLLVHGIKSQNELIHEVTGGRRTTVFDFDRDHNVGGERLPDQ